MAPFRVLNIWKWFGISCAMLFWMIVGTRFDWGRYFSTI
jgi:hypothetical protein